MKTSKTLKKITSVVIAFAMLMLVMPGALASEAITSSVYSVATDTISGVLPQTVVYDFLQRITPEGTEEMTLWRSGERIYSGYIKDGDILKCGNSEYTVFLENTVMFDLLDNVKNAQDGTIFSKSSGTAMDVSSLASYGVAGYRCDNSSSATNAEYSIVKGTADSKPYLDITNDQNRTMFIHFFFADADYENAGKYLVTEMDITPLNSNVHARVHYYMNSGDRDLYELEHFSAASGSDYNSEFKIGHDGKYSIGGVKGKNEPSWVSSNTNMTAQNWRANDNLKVKKYRVIGEKAAADNLEVPQLYVEKNGVPASFGPFSFPVTRAYGYARGITIGVGSSANGTAGTVRIKNLKVYIADSYPSSVSDADLTNSGRFTIEGDEISGIYLDEDMSAGDFLDEITVSPKAAKLVLDTQNNVKDSSTPLADGMKLRIESANGETVNEYTIKVEQRPKITVSILPYESLEVGETLSADYDVIGPNVVSGVTYKWLFCATENGVYDEIENAEESTLTLTSDLWKKYIKAEITPVGENELAVSSAAVGPVTDEKAESTELINASTHLNIKENIGAMAQTYEEIEALWETLDSDYKLSLACLNMLKGIPYANFDAIVSAFTASARAVNDAFNDTSVVSLDPVASNEGTIATGHVDVTPVENVFKYGGKEFIVIDSTDTEMYVITKDYYGTKAAYGGSEAEAKGKYDAMDEKSIAYFLNRDFITDGNGGSVLPDGILNYINYSKVWVSEPQSGMIATKTVGGIGLLSATEYKANASRIGEDTIPSNAVLYYLRTPNSDYEIHMLGLSLREVNGVSTRGSFVGSKSNTARNLRPAFYLDKSFFEKNKLAQMGSDVAKRVASICSEEKLRELYTEAEIDEFFKAPEIMSAEVSGRPIVGNTLTADYVYESDFAESGTQYQWYASTRRGSGYSPITGKVGKTLTLDNSLAGKFIEVKITPRSELAINGEGEEFTSEATVCAVMTKEAADSAAAALNSVSAGEIHAYLQENDDIFQASLMENDVDIRNLAISYLAQSDFTTMAEYEKDMNTCITMAKIRAGAESEVENIIKTTQSSINKKNYTELADKSSVNSYIKATSFTSAEDFVRKVDEKVGVTYFNNATRDNIEDALLRLDDMIEKDISALTPTQLEALGLGILTVDSYINMAAVNTKINELYPSDTENEPEVNIPVSGADNNSGGGGGGGGGSYSGVASPAATQTQNTQSNAQSSPFSDMNGYEWANTAVISLVSRGIINGMGDGRFAPQDTLTREQFIKMIVTAFNLKSSGRENPFTDVATGHWSTDYIMAAYENGITTGIDETKFGVGTSLSKEQMVTFIYRALEKCGITVKTQSTATIKDKDNVSVYASDAVAALGSAGIVSGDENGYFNPSQTATRAMAAVVIYKTLENAEVIK